LSSIAWGWNHDVDNDDDNVDNDDDDVDHDDDDPHVNVLDDGGVEAAVEGVGGVALPWPGLEQVLHPAPPVQGRHGYTRHDRHDCMS
jgi:hypothetical protein